MNSVVFVGRLVAAPEARTAGTTQVVNFRIAVPRRFKREGQPDADFFDCCAFAKTAELVNKYLGKGSKIGVTGRLQNDNYTDKDGRTIYRNRIYADSVDFLDDRHGEGTGTATPAPTTGPTAAPGQATPPASGTPSRTYDTLPDEELPFS